MLTLILAAQLVTPPAPSPTPPPRREGPFLVEPLVPGVTLLRDPAGTNTLVVERADGLLLVDAQGTAERGKAAAAAVAALWSRPVRWIVLTQPHVEAWGGAAAFPGATLVASRGARQALEDAAYDPAAEYTARFPGATPSATRPHPTVVLQSLTLLDDAERPVELIPFPRGHTDGDLVVRLTAERVVHVGDLVATDRNPWAGPESRIGGWVIQLNEIASWAPGIVVATRGAAATDPDLRRQREAMAWARSQTAAAFVDVVKVADIPARLEALPGFAAFFDPLATPSFARLVIDQAVAESVEDRRKRGMPVD